MSSKTVSLATDVATLVLFHPDDLSHRHADPIAWYAYDFVYQRESRAGRLVAFGTGADGGYDVRLTTQGLTQREADLACASWDFPFIVHHGRVLLDNTDALPGEEQMTDPATLSNRWFDVANGAYRVTVYPIEWTAETGTIHEDGAARPALPTHVITFEPVADITEIPAVNTPPDLRALRTWRPDPSPSMDSERSLEWPPRNAKPAPLPLLVCDEATALLPGQTATLSVADRVAETVFPDDGDPIDFLLVAPEARPDALAVIADVTGCARSRGGPLKLSLQGSSVARLARIMRADPLPMAAFTVLEKPDMEASDTVLAAFRAKLARLAADNAAFRSRLRYVAFESERLDALTSADAVTSWALRYLELPLTDRLSVYARPAGERISVLDQFLTTGRLPPGRKRSLIDRLKRWI